MKLSSMTEFVLEQGGASVESDLFYFLCSNYAQFLKEPLTLGMFVPCYLRDGIWIPYTKDTLVNTIELFNEFEQAKERVLFDFQGGVKLLRNRDNFFILEDINGVYLRTLKFNTKNTIESLFKFSVEITLTPSVIKQIGL